MTVSAQEVCHQLLYQLRQSNLNFQVSETSYSAQILLRKRFLKESLGPAPYFNLPSTQNNHDLEDQLNTFFLRSIWAEYGVSETWKLRLLCLNW